MRWATFGPWRHPGREQIKVATALCRRVFGVKVEREDRRNVFGDNDIAQRQTVGGLRVAHEFVEPSTEQTLEGFGFYHCCPRSPWT